MLAARLEREIDALEGQATPPAEPKRVLFVLTVRDGAALVAGRETAANEAIRLAGARNPAEFDSYKTMSPEAIVAAAPDLVLMTEEHAAVLGSVRAVIAQPAFANTPAGRSDGAMALPALTVLSLGPRTPDAIRALRAKLAEIR